MKSICYEVKLKMQVYGMRGEMTVYPGDVLIVCASKFFVMRPQEEKSRFVRLSL